MTSSSRRVHNVLAALAAILLPSAPRALAGDLIDAWHSADAKIAGDAYEARPSMIGVWRPGNGANPQPLFAVTPNQVDGVLAAHQASGERVRDFERYAVGNEVFYAFVFEAGTGLDTLQRDLTANELLAAASNDLRLADLETYLVAGQRRWAALFHGAADGQSVELDLEGAALKASVEAEGDLDLEDFEVYRNAAGVHYAAVFAAGTGTQKFEPSLGAEEFHSQAHALSQQGYRLQDVETWLAGDGEPRFAALWQQGTGGDFLRVDRYYSPEYQSFEQLSELFLDVFAKVELAKPSLRLIDLEIPWSESPPLFVAQVQAAQQTAPTPGGRIAQRKPAGPSRRKLPASGALTTPTKGDPNLPAPLHDSGTEIPP